MTLVMLGAGLLWFGWYGFNAGSALNSNGIAASTFITTTVATAAAMLSWLLTEKIRDGHATSLGAASGIVAGRTRIRLGRRPQTRRGVPPTPPGPQATRAEAGPNRAVGWS